MMESVTDIRRVAEDMEDVKLPVRRCVPCISNLEAALPQGRGCACDLSLETASTERGRDSAKHRHS
jgi:hypothetical protein